MRYSMPETNRALKAIGDLLGMKASKVAVGAADIAGKAIHEGGKIAARAPAFAAKYEAAEPIVGPIVKPLAELISNMVHNVFRR